MPILRKQMRLPRRYYLGARGYFVTVCCDLRRAFLAEAATAELVRACLLDVAQRDGFLVAAYCVTPDHLHFLAQGMIEGADLCQCIRTFKSRSAFAFRQRRNCQLWEASYYEHILREEDSPEEIAHYIWWNPVRKGLCKEPEEYPYSGSQTILWGNGAIPPTTWVPPDGVVAEL